MRNNKTDIERTIRKNITKYSICVTCLVAFGIACGMVTEPSSFGMWFACLSSGIQLCIATGFFSIALALFIFIFNSYD